MKKVLVILCVFVAVFGIATALRAGMTAPGVLDTPHDVQVMTGETGLEPCAMCHSPHATGAEYPIWNRDQAAQSYTMYNSATFDMDGNATGPGNPSSLCLVCHNGVFSTLINYPGPGSHQNESYDFEMNPTFWAMIGTDLHNDHPISFLYNPTLDDNQDRNGFPPVVNCPVGVANRAFVQADDCVSTTNGFGPGFPLYGTGTSNRMFECATCHAVHDTVDYPGKQLVGGKSVGNQVFFLRCDNQGSQFCGDCHKRRLGKTGQLASPVW
jgi:hypothetical protein